jgi:hypothetical protein
MTQIKSGYDAVIDTLNEMVLCFGFAPISSFVLTTSPRRLPLSDWRPSSLPGMPSLLAVNNCRSSCSQVLSASLCADMIFGKDNRQFQLPREDFTPSRKWPNAALVIDPRLG